MRHAFSCALLLALAACGGSNPVADDAEKSAGLPEPPNVNAMGASGGAPVEARSRSPATEPAQAEGGAAAIPAAMHGRWGLTPDDCTTTRGDAKGLLTVSATELRFYESVGRPVKNVQASANSYSADFAFLGEGMDWTKFQTLQLREGLLVRTESNPMASFTYVRCS